MKLITLYILHNLVFISGANNSGTGCIYEIQYFMKIILKLCCIWHLDVIKRTGVINCSNTSATGRKLASGFTEDPSVLHGSTIRDVQHVDVASGRILYAVGNKTDVYDPAIPYP